MGAKFKFLSTYQILTVLQTSALSILHTNFVNTCINKKVESSEALEVKIILCHKTRQKIIFHQCAGLRKIVEGK
jgi:hypothetical protein